MSADLLARLIEAGTPPELITEVAMLAARLEVAQRQSASSITSRPPVGYVYFITVGGDAPTRVKIGFTRRSPAARMSALQTGCPDQMRLYGFVPGDAAHEIELHDVLADDRLQGEWFAWSAYVEQVIANVLRSGYVA